MDNLYQPPAADLELPTTETASTFFVSSPLKLTVLYVATFGIYSFYWFYKHWKALQPQLDEAITPWARALFYWFFTHALFQTISDRQKAEGQPAWHYSGLAWLVIASDIISRLLDRLGNKVDIANGGSTTLFLGLWSGSILFALLPLASLLAAQRRANALAGDAGGSGNSHFSLYNMIFVLIGIVGWGSLAWMAMQL